MEGATTFHFLAAAPAEPLETAREAADGQDVRIGAALEQAYDVEAVSSPSGVTHLTFTRTVVS